MNHQIVVLIILGLGITFLPGADSRRRGSSSNTNQDPVPILPRDYQFANKVNSTCMYRRKEYTHPEVLNTINIIKMFIKDLRNELVSKNEGFMLLQSSITVQDIEDCSGLTLTSLLPTSEVPNQNITSLHLSVTSMSAHLFVMKMDWLLSRGLPCVSLAKSFSLRRLHSRLE